MSVLFSLLRWLFHKLPLSAVQKDKLAHWFYRRFRFLRELQKREVVQNIYSPEMVGGLTEGLSGMEEGVIHEPCRVANGVWEWTAYEEVQRDIARQRGKKTRKGTSAALSIFEMGGKSPGGFAKSIHLPVPPSQPEVSIIVPVYNHISLTLECLRSIAEYTGGDVSYEVLVADDASTDSSAAVLAGIPNLTLIRNVSNLGFLRNCNRALQHVRGKYVLFLNNDVQVAPGWLSSLYSTFLQYPKVGAVGPKFIYPNGFLQEAGAAFRYDAMSDMIGLNDDADQPRYNYTRRVDYVSGACLMAPTELVQKLGGFSEEFLPCYCEDSDLCLRIRQEGYDVYYNSDAVILHHLSKTTAQIESDFKLRSISRNIVKLKQKWIHEISSLSVVKAVAFYMPHYYPCPENESLGGKGYSGWTALANRALAAGCDRNLLRVPADLGFYDQRRPEILEEQVALAKRYGISAFCFYAYLSGGEIAWGAPLSHMLGQGAPDMPYCICLSDSTPDFNKKGILDSRMDGVNSPFEIQGLMAHLKNPRYLKVAGKPLLLLDVDSSETDYKTRISHLREYSLKEGLEGLYIVLVRPARLAILSGLPTDLGFDAALELPAIPSGHTPYSGFAAACVGAEFPAYPQFRCAYAGWEGGLVGDTPPDPTLKDPSPGAFQAWLEALAEEARVQHFGEERMVFIHAWNDWVHGASLEPDQRFGHTYLEAVRNALDAPGALEKNKRYLLN